MATKKTSAETKKTTSTKKTSIASKTTTKKPAAKTNTSKTTAKKATAKKATTKQTAKKSTTKTVKKAEPKKEVAKPTAKKSATKKGKTTNKKATTKKTTSKKTSSAKKQNGIFFIGNKKATKPSTKKAVKNNKLKLITYILVFIVLAGIIAVSLFNIITWLLDNKKANDLVKDITGEYEVKINVAQGDLVNAPEDKASDYWYYINMPFYNVNFDNLLKINKDTVGFIHIDNTNVNYPVVQSKDNSYYLNHSFDGKKNGGGWLFMDFRNNIDELSDNTVIYGHGRKNKTMFGTLSNVLTPEWQNNKDNYVIYFSTKKENLVFQIFSIYYIKEELYYIQTDFNSTKDKDKWLKTMKNRNMAPITTNVNTNDKIITLSTCKNNNGDRIVVHAKLIKKQVK